MNSQNKKNKIEKFLQDIGIAEYGFTSSEPFIGYANFLESSHNGHGTYFDVGYNKTMCDRSFYDPSHHLEGANSIITIILPYNLNRENEDEEDYICRLSKASTFRDYHFLAKEYLDRIKNFIVEDLGEDAVGFCDTGPLNDKALLLRTRQFKILNNSLLWHPRFGTRFYIAYLITNMHLSDKGDLSKREYNDLKHSFCSTCGRCKEICPNGAIVTHGHLKSSRCISYLTQSKLWKDNELSTEGLSLGGYVYGCDLCQLVCPLNKQEIPARYNHQPVVNEKVDHDLIKGLSNREFKEKYGISSAGWIGKKRFLRNIRENQKILKDRN